MFSIITLMLLPLSFNYILIAVKLCNADFVLNVRIFSYKSILPNNCKVKGKIPSSEMETSKVA